MFIALPPSEGKTPPTTGPALNLDTLSFLRDDVPARAAHQTVAQGLAQVSGGPHWSKVLGISERLADQAAWNLNLDTAPCAPAAEVYTGVLYDAAGLSSVNLPAAAAAGARVGIFSGLWGVVDPSDLIPAYRLAMGVSLPGIGRLATHWKPVLANTLAPWAAGLVVDCRSADYAAAWNPGPDAEVVQIRAAQERNGVRKTITHFAKHARGVLTGHLLRRSATAVPQDAEQVADAAAELLGEQFGNSGTLKAVELSAPRGAVVELTLVLSPE